MHRRITEDETNEQAAPEHEDHTHSYSKIQESSCTANKRKQAKATGWDTEKREGNLKRNPPFSLVIETAHL